MCSASWCARHHCTHITMESSTTHVQHLTSVLHALDVQPTQQREARRHICVRWLRLRPLRIICQVRLRHWLALLLPGSAKYVVLWCYH